MTWVDNILLADDGSLFTVLPGGTLEIRGDGWTGPRRRKQPPGADNPRVCLLGDEASARRIAELIAKMIAPEVNKIGSDGKK